MAKDSSAKGDPGPSVKDPEVYEALRDDGASKEKAARIANAAANSSRSQVGRKGGHGEDYDERTQGTIEAWKSMNGKQGGDPAKLAAALITIAAEEQPPLRWLAGADAVRTAEDKARLFLEQADAYREQCSSLAHDDQ